jgi:hypothetical protein
MNAFLSMNTTAKFQILKNRVRQPDSMLLHLLIMLLAICKLMIHGGMLIERCEPTPCQPYIT